MNAEQVLAKTVERAKKTTVFEHPETGMIIILAHPGQTINRDAKFLRENFGILPQHHGGIKLLSETAQAPMTAAEKEAAGVGTVEPAMRTATAISSGPTAAEHDALVARIADLEELVEKLTGGDVDGPTAGAPATAAAAKAK